jgi:hypothetical protein
MTLFKNDIEKAWCHDFENEGKEVESENKKNLENIKVDTYTSKSKAYDEMEITLNKIDDVNPMDRPYFIFNLSKTFKTTKSEKQLTELLEKSVKLDYITKSQKTEILRIIES